MTKEEQILRGNQAKQLLDNALFKEFLDELDRATIKQIDKVPVLGINVEEKQRQVILIRQMKNKFVKLMTTCIETGKMASL